MKPLISSKTFWFACLQALLAVYTAAVAVNPAIQDMGYLVTASAVIQMILRYNTSTPISGVVSWTAYLVAAVSPQWKVEFSWKTFGFNIKQLLLFVLAIGIIVIIAWPLIAKALVTDEQGYFIEPGNTTGRALVPVGGVKLPVEVPYTPKSHNGPSVDSATTQAILEVFPQNPEMLKIAQCESGVSQFRADGSILMGGDNNHFVGIFQINQSWATTAKPMGLDIYTINGNIQFARFLLETYGKDQWECKA